MQRSLTNPGKSCAIYYENSVSTSVGSRSAPLAPRSSRCQWVLVWVHAQVLHTTRRVCAAPQADACFTPCLANQCSTTAPTVPALSTHSANCRLWGWPSPPCQTTACTVQQSTAAVFCVQSITSPRALTVHQTQSVPLPVDSDLDCDLCGPCASCKVHIAHRSCVFGLQWMVHKRKTQVAGVPGTFENPTDTGLRPVPRDCVLKTVCAVANDFSLHVPGPIGRHPLLQVRTIRGMS
jgi:hypothetical protein